MAQDANASAVFITEEYVSFSEVLEGKLGPREAGAARFWVEQGSIIEPPPKDANWISTDAPADCYDTRVWDPIDEAQDAGAAAAVAADLGNSADAFAAPAPQKPKAAKGSRPRPKAAEQNIYTKAAFVGHSDTLGTLARRKARSSRNADLSSDEAAEDADGTNGTRPSMEELPPSVALGKLPSGWKVYDLALDGPRDTKVAGGRMYVSPTGMVCKTFEIARAMSKAEGNQCRWTYDIKSALTWIKSQGTSSRATLKTNVDVVFPRYLVALQRRKTALKPQSKKSKKSKKREMDDQGKKKETTAPKSRRNNQVPQIAIKSEAVIDKPESVEKRKMENNDLGANPPQPRKKSRKPSVVEHLPKRT